MKLFNKDTKRKRKEGSIISKYLYPLIFAIIVGAVCFFVGRQIGLNTDTSKTTTTVTEETVSTHTITNTLSASGEIVTSASKKLKPSTSYYFKKVYVEVGDAVSKGDILLEYSNGKYLKAPYDLVVTAINVPTSGKKITSSHYISVERTDKLVVDLSINESEITNISVGQEVTVTLNSDDTKSYTGKITKINAIGSYSSSGSTFTVEVQLKNDGNIKLGMSVSCTISIETKENALAVPVDAVEIDGDNRYVVVVSNGKTKNVTVETGISDGDYVEITSGLSGGETIQITTTTTESTIRSTSNESSGMGGQMPSGGFDMSNMPSGGNQSGERPSRNYQGSGSGSAPSGK